MTPDNCSYKSIDFCEDTSAISSREFLDRHATVNHDDVCLSYVFTGKSFGGDGSVGLAWTASTTGAGWVRISGRELCVSLPIFADHGGICELYRELASGNRSLNTGFVSFEHNGVALEEDVTKFAFAHEIGHSFGSLVRQKQIKLRLQFSNSLLDIMYLARLSTRMSSRTRRWKISHAHSRNKVRDTN